MSVSHPSLTVQTVAAAKSRAWIEPLLGLATGVLGGAIQSKILSAPMSHSILLGGIFGLAFGLFFARRATTPGAGLIWGLGGALLLWFVMPTGIKVLLLRSASSLKLDVGGGFLGCLWKFNEIKSKTVRAFAQRVEDLVFVFKFISVQIGFLVSLAVFDEAVDQTA